MIKGLYSAYTSMETAWRYQEILSDNIANATTVGFKREVAAALTLPSVLVAQQEPVPAPLPARIQHVIGQVGTGRFLAEFETDFSAGPWKQTGEELDFALEEGFFVVQSPAGERFYTRDGRFGRDANGTLVTSTGYYVLGSDGQPIVLPPERVSVAEDGTIRAGDIVVGQLMVVAFAPGELQRAGPAYFTAEGPGTPVARGVHQGYLELSNAQLTEELTTLLAVHRAYQASQTVLATLDGTLERAAGELGRFGG